MPTFDVDSHLTKKQRYVTLDGLRGVAALMVVLGHIGHRLGTWTPHFGYLAVDLFFLLSGFVLAYNYEPRFRLGMSVREFLVARIVRLYPLYFLGLVLGASVALLNFDLQGLTLEGDLMAFVFGLFGLPSYTLPHPPLDIFSVNIPFWSLFFEFWVANVIFVLIRNVLSSKNLALIVLACGVGFFVSQRIFYTIDVGYVWNTFVAGFPRVGFSFFLGVALARLHRASPPNLKLPSWVFVLALPVVLLPPLGGSMSHRYELACVFVLFPAMVYWGAEAVERRPWVGALLGDTSYALYTIHYPLWVLAAWVLSKLAVEPSLILQLLFLIVVTIMAWGLSIADTRVRVILMSRVRKGALRRRITSVSEPGVQQVHAQGVRPRSE